MAEILTNYSIFLALAGISLLVLSCGMFMEGRDIAGDTFAVGAALFCTSYVLAQVAERLEWRRPDRD